MDHCSRCGQEKPDIEKRYSFNLYAGRICTKCCAGFRDNCGIGQPQGNQADLDEPIDEDE